MSIKLLNTISKPKDLRKLSIEELLQLAVELREFIIDIVATKEGHLGASLGVIELTIALHYVFDTPNDLLVWDVGHQAYGHKILTERKNTFHTNRQLRGLSGFPKRNESKYDAFGVGHSSTSISAALGMAIASKLKGESEKQHIAIIGDASIASGMAFEGLNHAGVTDANLLIILNDNAMGIDPSVGALKNYLTNIKKDKKVRRHNIIEALNFDYSGPIDGHNLNAVIEELERLKSVKGPRFLHITTTKGKGLQKAEEDQVKYHAPGKFDKITGETIPKEALRLPPKYQDIFGLTLVELAKQNKKIIGITPAMPTGSSLKFMLDEMPERAFDVGIAEQHAVTLAAGMATQGMIPFCNIYSTFLQRAYDQIIHDVALQKLSVIFCLDRAGLVGEDGATHHGVFDIPYLRCIPNMVIFAPMNEIELRNMMYTAQLGLNSPIAIRYPRGRGVTLDWQRSFKKIELGKGQLIKQGSEIATLSLGTIGNTLIEAYQSLSDNDKIAHYNMRFVKPLDTALLHIIFQKFDKILTIEDGTIVGGFGSAILEFAQENNYHNKNVKRLGMPDQFIEHGTVAQLHQQVRLDKKSILKVIKEFLK
ncbi:MAG: 1-deoxy-D-xylulose-5-phosphate synthase [Flavobacteriaceae bacterium]|nr:1-deoxy-D-xylulose-5-phosphate synthase [Flavobacteriaceae bacterium]